MERRRKELEGLRFLPKSFSGHPSMDAHCLCSHQLPPFSLVFKKEIQKFSPSVMQNDFPFLGNFGNQFPGHRKVGVWAGSGPACVLCIRQNTGRVYNAFMLYKSIPSQ